MIRERRWLSREAILLSVGLGAVWLCGIGWGVPDGFAPNRITQWGHELPVIAPLHPRTRQRLAELGVLLGERVRAIPPAGYVEFLQLHRNAALVLTDSGGVQEEACALRVPCVILRETTERPEAVHVGAARIAGVSSEQILHATRELFGNRGSWQNPFGDGKAGERIAALVAGLAG